MKIRLNKINNDESLSIKILYLIVKVTHTSEHTGAAETRPECSEEADEWHGWADDDQDDSDVLSEVTIPAQISDLEVRQESGVHKEDYTSRQQA